MHNDPLSGGRIAPQGIAVAVPEDVQRQLDMLFDWFALGRGGKTELALVGGRLGVGAGPGSRAAAPGGAGLMSIEVPV